MDTYENAMASFEVTRLTDALRSAPEPFIQVAWLNGQDRGGNSEAWATRLHDSNDALRLVVRITANQIAWLTVAGKAYLVQGFELKSDEVD
jgi:hypothetical protein